MGQTLDNGIYLPSEGERNCYEGLAGNWVALDNHLGSTNIHVTINDKQAWDGHVADSVKHVTAEDKAKWDAVTSKANDSDVVHKSGNETISGIKTFSSRAVFNSPSKDGELTLRQNAYDPATNGQSALSSTCGFTVTARTVTNGSFAQIGFYGAPGFTTTRLNCRYYTGASESEESWVEYTVVGTSGSITGRSFKPGNNGLVDLGTNANRWKDVNTYLVNGLTPSSLSLPGLNNAVDISGYITDLAGSPNIYSPPANGYIILRSTTANVLGIVENTTGMGSYSRGSNQILAVYLPVVKNSRISIYAICSSLTQAKFIPCQGNI